MGAQTFSQLVGTGAVWVILAAAIAIALRRPVGPDRLASATGFGALTLALQAAHFGEELTQGFGRRFPEALGLTPWSDGFFAGFNIVWLAVWAAAVAAAFFRRATVPAAAALWFLGLAAIVNGLAHPVLALMNGGYFPGVITAPFLGLAGLGLVWRLSRGAGARITTT